MPASHKKGFWNPDRASQWKLTFATMLFLACSGCSVFVLSQMATATLTELVYLSKTTCRVTELTLIPEPVPCIIPSCGNILSQTGCRQIGYCIRMTVNFTMEAKHADEWNLPTSQTNNVPMQDLNLRDNYKDSHSVKCIGYKPGIDGDRVCRPTKEYDTGKYVPAVGVEPAATDAADGRMLQLLDDTDSGPCAAITCREDGNKSLQEARELMSYWPIGSTLKTCWYLRSFDSVDQYFNSGSAPIIIAKTFDLMMVGIYVAASTLAFAVSCKCCTERLEKHHELSERATNQDFVYGVAGTTNKDKHARLRSG